MFCKPFQESAHNKAVLNTGFKSEVIVWQEKQMNHECQFYIVIMSHIIDLNFTGCHGLG